MSFYEELLTLGQHLHDHKRVALYKFLLESENHRYSRQARELINLREVRETMANGEIIFKFDDNKISYSALNRETSELYENIREAKLGLLPFLNVRRVKHFIAQAEVEVIWNFPLPGVNPQERSGYVIISYPFSDLRYFANGKSRVLGLINKIKAADSETLRQLRAS